MDNPARVSLPAALLAAALVLPAPRPAHAQVIDGGLAAAVERAALQAAQEGEPARRFDLTLDTAVERALERNLEITVQRVNPLLQDMQVATANAAFLPIATSGFGMNQSTFPNRSLFDGGGLGGRNIVTDRGNYDLGVNQRVRWGGGQYGLTWDSSRSESNNIFNSFNPSYGANMSLNYTQPLLRGFRTDPQRTQLVVSRINRDISDIDLEQTIVNTLASVRSAYWDLVYARAAVQVQQQALELAEQLVRDNQARVEIGTLAPIDVVQAQSEAALRRQTLAQAVQTLRTAELALKQLIVDGTEDELWNAELNPTDQPQIETVPIDVDGAIRGALDRRTDISRARRQLDISDAQVDNLRNSTLPALDLVGSYQLTGQGGPRLIPAGSSFEALFGGAGGVLPGGYGDAIDDIVDADYPIWSVSLQMTWPLGTSAEEADHERARLQLQQSRTQNPADRAADRDRGDQRGAPDRRHRAADRGGDGVAGARRGAVAGGGEQVRGRPVDQLLRRAGAARSRRGAGHRATGDSRLSAGADRVRAGPAHLARRRRRHHRGRRGLLATEAPPSPTFRKKVSDEANPPRRFRPGRRRRRLRLLRRGHERVHAGSEHGRGHGG